LKFECDLFTKSDDDNCFKFGIDYSGNDLSGETHTVSIGASAPHECQKLCAANDKCEFFSVNRDSGACNLKTSKIGEKSGDYSLVSGPKQCPPVDECTELPFNPCQNGFTCVDKESGYECLAPVPAPVPVATDNCKDEHKDCQDRAKAGECETNPVYVVPYCKLSCGLCFTQDPCKTNNGGCDPNAICTMNFKGEASCTCPKSYWGDGFECNKCGESGCPTQFCIEYGIDYAGNELSDGQHEVSLGANAINECQKLCAENDKCLFFTLEKTTGFCSLKYSRWGHPTKNDNLLFGPKQCPSDDCFEVGVAYRNDFSVGVLRQVSIGSNAVTECQVLCAADPDCQFFTADTFSGNCWMKNSNPGTITKNENYVIGPKHCPSVDVCSINNGGCSQNADCYIDTGIAKCICKEMYQGDGKTCTRVKDPVCVESGYAYDSGHMVDGDADGDTVKECLQSCQSNNACKYWDYDGDYCRLRSNTGPHGLMKRAGAAAGARDSKVCSTECTKPGYAYDSGKMVDDDADADCDDDCLESCQENNACKFWDYDGRYCRLRSNAGPNGLMKRSGAVAGARNSIVCSAVYDLESGVGIGKGGEFLFRTESIDKSKVLLACALFAGIGYAISIYGRKDKTGESAYLLEEI